MQIDWDMPELHDCQTCRGFWRMLRRLTDDNIVNWAAICFDHAGDLHYDDEATTCPGCLFARHLRRDHQSYYVVLMLQREAVRRTWI